MPRPELTRRDWLRLAASGVAATSASGWLEALADDSATDPKRRRSCILLWMSGGPSQLDTLDPKHSDIGRPIRIADPSARPIRELLA